MKTVCSIQLSPNHLPQIKACGIAKNHKESWNKNFQTANYVLHYYLHNGSIQINENKYYFKHSDITITPKNTPSKYLAVSGKEGEYLYIHFAQKTGPLTISEHIPANLLSKHCLAEFQQIIRQYLTPTSAFHENNVNPLLASNLLHRLLLELSMAQFRKLQPETACTKAIRKLIKHIEMNLDRELTISELSGIAGLSQNYLARHFKIIYGKTIKCYIISRRIERACYLLGNTTIQIKEVAFRCGISNAQYFNKLFRHAKNISPSKYRNKYGLKIHLPHHNP